MQEPIKVDRAIRAELGNSYDFILTASIALDRLVGLAEDDGVMLRTRLIAKPLQSGDNQRIVEILIFDRNESLTFPAKRTGEVAEMFAYKKASRLINAMMEEARTSKTNGLRLVRGGNSFASRLRQKFI